MEKLRRKRWLYLFIFFLSLNVSAARQKIRNNTGSRHIFKLSRRVIPLVNSIRFANESLTLQGNQEVFIKIPSSTDFSLSMQAKFSKGALLYVFFHLKNETNRSGYAFRISAARGAPSAFLKFEKSHVVSKKVSTDTTQKRLLKGWHAIVISSRNRRHILQIDGKEILNVHDASFTSGDASIGSGIKSFTVDNLSVTSGAWHYADDFSIKNKNNKNYNPLSRIKAFAVIFAVLTLLSFFLRRRMHFSSEDKRAYEGHLKIQILLLIPGAFLHVHDALCFIGTMTSCLLFLIRTFKLFARTNTFFILPGAEETRGAAPAIDSRRMTRVIAGAVFILCVLYAFLRSDSRIFCSLSSCQKTLLMEKSALLFNTKPYFFDDAVNARNPALSFDVYGRDGAAALIIFNKGYPEIETPAGAYIDPSINESHAMLLSFHKTLSTLLMKGQKIIQAAHAASFLKNQWNHVEILTSGRNIVFFLNNKKILSYHARKLFRGGVKILPVYKIPQIKNLRVYSLHAETSPFLFNAADTVFFLLRLVLFLFIFLCASYFLLYFSVKHGMILSFYLKKAAALFSFPLFLWTATEIGQHSASGGGNFPPPALRFIALFSCMASFLLLHFFIAKRADAFSFRSFKRKVLFLFASFLFFEGLCISISPYMETLQKPWYYFVHDKSHYWYFDPHARLYNEYFDLNKVRSKNVPYAKKRKIRIALFGSSSAYGQFFPAPSSRIYSSQLETKLLKAGYDAEVLNFAIQGSTSFTGFVFLKGVYPLFKPDIVLWNYAGNDLLFMRGTFQNYDFLQALYTQREYAPLRMLYTLYSFHLLSNISDLTWIKALLFLPRAGYKRALYEKNLLKLYSFCRRNHIQLVLVHESSDEAIWFRYDAAKKRFLDRQDKWFYHALHSIAGKYGIPYVFTVPELIKHRDDRLYLDTVHYSKAGHDVMADILFDFLVKNKLVR